MNKTKYNNEQILEVCKLKEGKTSHRKIAKKVFGKKSMCSTVSMLLDKFYYGQEDIWKENLARKPKILILDIETAPAVSYHWGRWMINVGTVQVISRPYVISWSAKWLGEEEMFSDCISFYDDFEDDPMNDKKVCQSIWTLMDEADIIVAHYGKKFDFPMLNARFITNGLEPPSPYKVADTKDIASRNFKFEGNSLKELADHLGLDINKKDMTFKDWRNCVEGLGTPEGWNKMVTYNEYDVWTLEALYLKIRPWAINHPNTAIFHEDAIPTRRCMVCGSKKLKKLKGNAYTMVSKFETYRCECGHVQRTRQNIRDKEDMKLTMLNPTIS